MRKLGTGLLYHTSWSFCGGGQAASKMVEIKWWSTNFMLWPVLGEKIAICRCKRRYSENGFIEQCSSRLKSSPWGSYYLGGGNKHVRCWMLWFLLHVSNFKSIQPLNSFHERGNGKRFTLRAYTGLLLVWGKPAQLQQSSLACLAINLYIMHFHVLSHISFLVDRKSF